jgi:hypothetical protein
VTAAAGASKWASKARVVRITAARPSPSSSGVWAIKGES